MHAQGRSTGSETICALPATSTGNRDSEHNHHHLSPRDGEAGRIKDEKPCPCAFRSYQAAPFPQGNTHPRPCPVAFFPIFVDMTSSAHLRGQGDAETSKRNRARCAGRSSSVHRNMLMKVHEGRQPPTRLSSALLMGGSSQGHWRQNEDDLPLITLHGTHIMKVMSPGTGWGLRKVALQGGNDEESMHFHHCVRAAGSHPVCGAISRLGHAAKWL